ncbi:MAG: hypothetical protein ACKV0T_07255 [Planctomycetales bacterium]
MKRLSILSRFGLPLLTKELVEQAARKRTYVLRVVYAMLLFVSAFLLFQGVFSTASTSPLALLGHGREVYDVILNLQFAGVYLFMPALTCGVITQEKERNSLMLLFLTRLGPWTIVVEKLLSRIVPMLCFLLLSLPLLAFAYSLGGISSAYLWSGVWMLMAATCQAGTVALFCSCWFRTTAGAFVWSYLLLAGAMFSPWLVSWVFGGWASQMGRMQPTLNGYQFVVLDRFVYESPSQFLLSLFAPVQIGNPLTTTSVVPTMVRSVPILAMSLLGLVLARASVVRRAFVPPRNWLLALLRLVDRMFVRWNDNRLTRGIVILKDDGSLPDLEPVAWRETAKRSVGRARYLLRIFIAIESPLVVGCLLVAIIGGGIGSTGVSVMLFLLWGLALLIVSVNAASLVSGERSHQTLDVLIATPLSGRQILLQKFRGVQRLILMLLVPFFTIFLFQSYWRGSSGYYNVLGFNRFHEQPWGLYVACSALTAVIYLPLIAWISFLIGLLVRTQARAIVVSLGVFVCWCVLPVLFVMIPMQVLFGPQLGSHNYLAMLSPAVIILFNELNELHHLSPSPWLAVILNFLGYGGILFVVRHISLAFADRFLGRGEDQ